MLVCRLLFSFFKIYFKTSFSFIKRVSFGLDPDQDRNNVDPDMGLNCLQWVSTDGKKLDLSTLENLFFTCSSGKWQNSRNDSSSSSTTETVWSHAENIIIQLLDARS